MHILCGRDILAIMNAFFFNVIRQRKQLKPVLEARGFKLSFMPFFIKAASMALQQFPILNSSIDTDCTKLIYKVNRFNLNTLMLKSLSFLTSVFTINRERIILALPWTQFMVC